VLLLSLVAGLSACSNRWYVSAAHSQSDDPNQNGYWYAMRQSILPDTAAHCRLLYTSGAGTSAFQRRVVWPELLAGYYGPDTVHDDIIIFGADLQVLPASHISNLLAAKDGRPAVDITKAAIRAVQKSRPDIQSLDLGYYSFETSASGVTMKLQHWIEGQKRSETVEATFTWHDVNDLVTRLRTSGTPHRFRGITYFSED
jgi:hypothetical protein